MRTPIRINCTISRQPSVTRKVRKTRIGDTCWSFIEPGVWLHVTCVQSPWKGAWQNNIPSRGDSSHPSPRVSTFAPHGGDEKCGAWSRGEARRRRGEMDFTSCQLYRSTFEG